VSSENLRVDKIGMTDGMLGPDGSADLVFTATVTGPFDALFVYSVDAKGTPSSGLRADTIIRTEEIPPELGSVVDTGKLTLGVGVIENGRFLNDPSGQVKVAEGTHQLTLYVPNPTTLQAGNSCGCGCGRAALSSPVPSSNTDVEVGAVGRGLASAFAPLDRSRGATGELATTALGMEEAVRWPWRVT
jgi:hypothetical protein